MAKKKATKASNWKFKQISVITYVYKDNKSGIVYTCSDNFVTSKQAKAHFERSFKKHGFSIIGYKFNYEDVHLPQRSPNGKAI